MSLLNDYRDSHARKEKTIQDLLPLLEHFIKDGYSLYRERA